MSSVVSRLKFLQAAREGNIQLGKEILDSSVFDLRSALVEMIDTGNTSFVRLLLGDSRLDLSSGDSPLELASIRGHADIGNLLLTDPRIDSLTDVVVEF